MENKMKIKRLTFVRDNEYEALFEDETSDDVIVLLKVITDPEKNIQYVQVNNRIFIHLFS